MNFHKVKKRLNSISQIVGQALQVSKQVIFGVGVVTLASGTVNAASGHPQPTLDPKVITERRILSKLAGKYLLKRSVSMNIGSSHTSHSSHSSHTSHSSHYSSSSSPSTTYDPLPAPAPTVRIPSHYSGGAVTQPAPANREPNTPAYTPDNPNAETSPVSTPKYSSNTVFSDNFTGLNKLSEKWVISSLIVAPSLTDQSIDVSVSDGEFKVVPRAGYEGRSYSGLTSKNFWDMTAAHVRVEVSQITNSTANTVFTIGTDSDNWYGFITESNKLFLQAKINGKKNSTHIPYNANKYKFWRLRHEAADNQILWEVSANGENWTIVRKLDVELNLTQMHVHLGAGTYLKETAPGTAIFSNFKMVVHKELY